MSEETKFTYVRDPRCAHRVLTLARKIVGDEIHFGYCVNKVYDANLKKLDDALSVAVNTVFTDPDDFFFGVEGKGEVTAILEGQAVIVLDKFDRKKGRAIAGGRLAKRPEVTPLSEDESPFLTVLKYLRDASTSNTVKRIAKEEIKWLENKFEE